MEFGMWARGVGLWNLECGRGVWGCGIWNVGVCARAEGLAGVWGGGRKRREPRCTCPSAQTLLACTCTPVLTPKPYNPLPPIPSPLQADSKRFEEVLDELDKALQASEGELARNPFKQRSLQLQEQIRALTEKKYELTEEERQSKRSPEELRADLMAKIKRDNTEVEQMTQQVRRRQGQEGGGGSRRSGVEAGS